MIEDQFRVTLVNSQKYQVGLVVHTQLYLPFSDDEFNQLKDNLEFEDPQQLMIVDYSGRIGRFIKCLDDLFQMNEMIKKVCCSADLKLLGTKVIRTSKEDMRLNYLMNIFKQELHPEEAVR